MLLSVNIIEFQNSNDCQNKVALPVDDSAILDFDCLGTQIGGKAVFLSMQKDNADDSDRMEATERDIRYGEQQHTIRATALRPCIFAWKGITPVSFDTSDGIPKPTGRFVNENRPIYRMPYTIQAGCCKRLLIWRRRGNSYQKSTESIIMLQSATCFLPLSTIFLVKSYTSGGF